MRKKKNNNRVRRFPGDKKPAASVSKHKMFYEAKRLADFQNKHKQWVPQGGIVKHLTMGKL